MKLPDLDQDLDIDLSQDQDQDQDIDQDQDLDRDLLKTPGFTALASYRRMTVLLEVPAA
jgi:hypothetical protein